MEHEIISKKKKWYKRKLLYVIAVVVLLVASIVYGQVKKSNKGHEYETAKVVKGTLTQTVDATGAVESADEIGLRFDASGRLASLYKTVGNAVKTGVVIASLDLSELNAKIGQSKANVDKAQADLNKEIAGNTDEYINNLSAKVDQAKANLGQIKASYDDSIDDAEADVKDAENDLKVAEGGEDSQIVNDAYSDMVALLHSVQDKVAAALTESDNILGIDNSQANDGYEKVLSILNTSKLSMAESKYIVAKSSKNNVDNAINTLSVHSEHGIIDWASDIAEDSLLVMKDLLFAVSEVLGSTPAIGGDLTTAELNTLKIGIQTERSNISTKYASLLDQKQAIETAKNSYSAFQIAYDKAVNNLENIKNKADADIAAYEALVSQSQANYDDAKNPPREVDLASYKAALSAARASLAQSVANQKKAMIIAPVDGVIGKLNYKIGEYVNSQDEVIKIVSPHFEIKVDIPETDIVKISLNNSAEVRLDAFGDDVVFDSMVTEVEKGETIIQDVVYYTVTLSLEDNPEYEILNGMTANILFFTEEKQNVLYVPQRAVRIGEQGKYIRVMENGEVKKVGVKTGLRGDGGLIEILEGLEEGQEAVVRIIED